MMSVELFSSPTYLQICLSFIHICPTLKVCPLSTVLPASTFSASKLGNSPLSVTPSLFIPVLRWVWAAIGLLREASHRRRLITAFVCPGSSILQFSVHEKEILPVPSPPPSPNILSLASDVPLTFSQAHLHQFHTSDALLCQSGS